jgi:hypothetical protein
VIFEGDVVVELSNQDHEVEKVLPTAFNVILLKAPPPLQIARKSVKSIKKGLKWSYKIGKCKELYVVMWLLIVHLKKVHEFIAKRESLGGLQLMKGAFDIKSFGYECPHLK